jgi:hypothetical protein
VCHAAPAQHRHTFPKAGTGNATTYPLHGRKESLKEGPKTAEEQSWGLNFSLPRSTLSLSFFSINCLWGSSIHDCCRLWEFNLKEKRQAQMTIEVHSLLG